MIVDRLAKAVIKVIGIFTGFVILIFGLHGLYVYFYIADKLNSPLGFFQLYDANIDGKALFFQVPMPNSQMGDLVEWMTKQGADTWFLPGIITLIAIGILYGSFKLD